MVFLQWVAIQEIEVIAAGRITHTPGYPAVNDRSVLRQDP